MSQEEKLQQFQNLTRTPEHIARAFLEDANWDFQTAVESFFDPGDEAASDNRHQEDDEEDGDEQAWGHPPPLPSGSRTGAPGNINTAPSRFATLGDVNRDDDDEDEGRQNYFAGGEKSGISIQNPNQSNAQDEVRNILRTAMNPPAPTTSAPTGPIPTRFTGTGYTLGSDTAPSVPVTQRSGPRAPEGPVRRRLTLYRNGFTIEDGPLYPFSDPESVEILREIRMGRVPKHVAGVERGEDVEMVLDNREHEEYTPPKRVRGFHGHGNRLGSAVPGEPVTVTPPPPPPTTTSASTQPAQPTPNIDPSQPQTTIQLRLADGTRIVTQFNLSSTMEDVYSFVGRARPTQGRAFVLQTIFPTRVLERGPKTIEQEGLKSGTIVMRWA